MPPPPDPPSIRFSDFSPGIRDNPGADYPPGTATNTNTTRCISNPGGALVPMPRRSTIIPGKDWLSGNPAGGSYMISGMFATGPVTPLTGTFSGAAAELFLASEYINGGNRNFNLERIRYDESPLVRETIKNVSLADATADTSGWGITWGVTRSNKAAPTTPPAVPIVVVAWAPARGGTSANWFVLTLPDDATPTSSTPYVLPAVAAQPLIAVHQGRIVIYEVTAYGHGANTAWSTSEDVQFTDPFNPSIRSAFENFVPENPNGYAFMSAMSANELFALKRNGGVVITGDLADPLVTNLPMVPGTTEQQRPAYSIQGLVYGSRYSGVWVWAHSDGAQHLSQYMNPDFWFITPDPILIGCRYQFDSLERWVLVPNNWIYNTDTNAWWRLDDTSYATVRYFSRFDTFIYGAVTTYTHSALNAIYTWDLTVKSRAYTWQSQPVWAVLDRVLEVREIVLEAQGQGTVTVTTFGRTGTAVNSAITLANTGYPERIRVNHTNKCFGLQVKIAADSGSDSIDAPTVFAVDVLYRKQEHLAVA